MTRPFRPLRRFRTLLPSGGASAGRIAALHGPGHDNPGGGNFFRGALENTRRPEAATPRSSAARGTLRKRFPGKLNVFQRAMLDWRDFHPYNAVHAVRIDRPFDAAALVAAIEAELTRHGLADLELDRARGRYAWRGGTARVALESIDAGADWEASLAQAFERHLNAPFALDGPLQAFRFFAMPVGGGFFLGVAYDHFMAGGDSIVTLVNAIVDRNAGTPDEGAPLRLYPPTHARLFVRQPWQCARAIARLPGMVASCRRTIRPRYGAIDDGYNGFELLRLDAGEYAALRRAAKRWAVTLNDMMMALLLLALDAIAPERDRGKRRHELAVASIMNLRREHRDDPRVTFGQYLSSFRISHDVPRGATLRDVAADIHRETTRIKRDRLYLATLVAVAADRLIGRYRTPTQRMSGYAKSYPVGAGVSSLNVGTLWRAGNGGPPVYVRGVPTGPASPLVVAVTTSGDAFYAGISYRRSALTPQTVEHLKSDIRRRIEALA